MERDLTRDGLGETCLNDRYMFYSLRQPGGIDFHPRTDLANGLAVEPPTKEVGSNR